jgi:hypothetical protein
VSSISTYAGSAGSNFVSVSGTATWSSTGNYTGAPDAVYSASGSLGSGTVTQTLDGYNFAPSVPGGSTINGFQYVVTAHRNGTRVMTIRSRVSWSGSTSTLGAWTGSNADASGLTGSDATYTWGGSTDLVGLTAPSVSDTNSAVEGTGPTISTYLTGTSGASAGTAQMDAVQQTVWYTASSAPTVSVSESVTTSDSLTVNLVDCPHASDSVTTSDSVSVQWYQPAGVVPSSDVTTTFWSCSSGSSFYTILDAANFSGSYVWNSGGISSEILWLGSTFNASVMSSILSVNYTVLWNNTDATHSGDFFLALYDSTQTTQLANTSVQVGPSSGNVTSTGTLGPTGAFGTVSNWNNFTFSLRSGTLGGDQQSNSHFYGLAVTINFIPSLLPSVSDSVTTSDSIGVNLLDLPSVSDSAMTSDAITISVDLDPTVSDSVATSDSVAVVVSGLFVSASDSCTTSDSVSIRDPEGLSVHDTVSTSDSVHVEVDCLISLADSISTSDSVGNSEGDLPPVQIEDDVTASDAVVIELDCFISVGETTITSDSVGGQVPDIFLSVSDNVTTNDSTLQVSGLPPFVAVGETTVCGETIAVTVSDLRISVSDSTATSDAASTLAVFLIKVKDTCATADSLMAVESVPDVEVFAAVDCVPSFKATVSNNPTYTATLMANPLYVDNANDVTVTSFQSSTGTTFNNAVLWVSLFDPSGTVVPGANTVQITYQSGTNGNYTVTLPASLGLSIGITYKRLVWSTNYNYSRFDFLQAVERTGI